MLLFANNAESTLKNGILAADVSLQVQDGHGARFPLPGVGDSFFLTLVDTLGNVEIVECTARVGDVMTIVRARDGTTAKSFAAGSQVDHRVVAEVLRRMSPETLIGADNGIAPLDGTGKVPVDFLPVTILTQALADARYPQLSQINAGNGIAGLDVTGKIGLAQLPASVATTTTIAATYIPLSQRGAADGVASLDSTGKVPAAQLAVDTTTLAPKVDPVFSNDITVAGDAMIGALQVTGTATLAATSVSTLAASGAVTIKGGAPIGKRTVSTAAPSGAGAQYDEWIQYAA